MELTNIFSLLGGLALFLYGMTMMSNGWDDNDVKWFRAGCRE